MDLPGPVRTRPMVDTRFRSGVGRKHFVHNNLVCTLIVKWIPTKVPCTRLDLQTLSVIPGTSDFINERLGNILFK